MSSPAAPDQLVAPDQLAARVQGQRHLGARVRQVRVAQVYRVFTRVEGNARLAAIGNVADNTAILHAQPVRAGQHALPTLTGCRS